MPNPNPAIIHAAAKVSVDDVRNAYYRQAPNDRTWIREFRTEPRELIVADDGSGGVARVGFEIGDDGKISFGEPTKVRVEYVEDEEPETVAASRMVYASAAESRPSTVTYPPPPPGFQPAEDPEPVEPSEPSADPQEPPAAEPDPSPTKEDDMSLTEVRQRLGLADDAEETVVLAAIDQLKTKADAAPDPKSVAAAAAEKDELTKEVGLLKGQVEAMSAKLSAAEEEKAKTIKASVLDTAAAEGKFAPAEREKWEADYDEAPAVVTRVLAAIAPGTKVPTTVQGKVGDPWDVAASDLPDEPEWLFSNPTPAMVGSDTKED